MRKAEKKQIDNERFVTNLRYKIFLQIDPRLERVDPRVVKKLDVLKTLSPESIGLNSGILRISEDYTKLQWAKQFCIKIDKI